MKHRCAGDVGALMGAIFYTAFGGENHTTALAGEGNAIPLWWLAPPPCPVGSMSLDSRVAGLPYESSSFATPQFGGAAKGKRLNGQARRLTSPHLEVLCRTSTGALWVLSHGAMSLQESIETYSAP